MRNRPARHFLVGDEFGIGLLETGNIVGKRVGRPLPFRVRVRAGGQTEEGGGFRHDTEKLPSVKKFEFRFHHEFSN